MCFDTVLDWIAKMRKTMEAIKFQTLAANCHQIILKGALRTEWVGGCQVMHPEERASLVRGPYNGDSYTVLKMRTTVKDGSECIDVCIVSIITKAATDKQCLCES